MIGEALILSFSLRARFFVQHGQGRSSCGDQCQRVNGNEGVEKFLVSSLVVLSGALRTGHADNQRSSPNQNSSKLIDRTE